MRGVLASRGRGAVHPRDSQVPGPCHPTSLTLYLKHLSAVGHAVPVLRMNRTYSLGEGLSVSSLLQFSLIFTISKIA